MERMSFKMKQCLLLISEEKAERKEYHFSTDRDASADIGIFRKDDGRLFSATTHAIRFGTLTRLLSCYFRVDLMKSKCLMLILSCCI